MDILPRGAQPAPPVPLEPLRQLGHELLQAMAAPADPRDTRTVQDVIDTYLAQLGEEISPRTRAMRERTLKMFAQYFGKTPKLNPAHEAAFAAFRWAIKQRPELARLRDKDVYAFLRSRPEYADKLPQSFATFGRYIRHYRRLVDHRGKR